LRAQKKWKIIYINNSDVENLANPKVSKQEVIIEPKINNNSNKIVETNGSDNLSSIYNDLKEDIRKKDELIKDLAVEVWKYKEIAKNSVSLVEFKKSQFLLWESKSYLNKELKEISKKKDKLIKELRYEKNTNIILILFVIVLLGLLWTIWFLKI
jgi:gas vesicle protein